MKRLVLGLLSLMISTLLMGSNILRVGDELLIYVSALDQEAAAPYNLPLIGEHGDALYYIVDEEGDIHMPILGPVHAEGLTISALRNSIELSLSKQIKNALVTIIPRGEYVSVLGEVNTPQQVAGSRISILEAIAAAGGLTKKGQRSTIYILREANGSTTRQTFTLDQLLNAEQTYFLTNHDIVYIK